MKGMQGGDRKHRAPRVGRGVAGTAPGARTWGRPPAAIPTECTTRRRAQVQQRHLLPSPILYRVMPGNDAQLPRIDHASHLIGSAHCGDTVPKRC